MSVTSFAEIHEGRNTSETFQGGKTIRRHTRVFRATTSSNYDDGLTIKAYLGCPRIGDTYPLDPYAWCQSVEPRNEPFSKRVWIVTAGYSTEREIQPNPLLEVAQYDWTTETFQRPYFKDTSAQGIVNSAGDPYDPPVEGDDSRISVRIEKNVGLVPTWIWEYKDAVNSDAVVIDGLAVAAGKAKLMGISLSRWQERNGYAYRVLTLQITLDANGWTKQVLDAGFRKKDPDDGTKRIHILDDDSCPVSSPALLDGSGAKLANPSASNAVFRTHTIYAEKAFSIIL